MIQVRSSCDYEKCIQFGFVSFTRIHKWMCLDRFSKFWGENVRNSIFVIH